MVFGSFTKFICTVTIFLDSPTYPGVPQAVCIAGIVSGSEAIFDNPKSLIIILEFSLLRIKRMHLDTHTHTHNVPVTKQIFRLKEIENTPIISPNTHTYIQSVDGATITEVHPL